MILKSNISKTEHTLSVLVLTGVCVCVCLADISPETHVLLEHVLCGHELHGFAPSTADHISTFLIFNFIILTHILL